MITYRELERSERSLYEEQAVEINRSVEIRGGGNWAKSYGSAFFGRVVVALDGESLKGYAAFNNSYLCYLAVDPNSRCKGIGQSLVNKVIELVGRTLQLNCRGNTSAYPFYKHQFSVVTEEDYGKYRNGDPKKYLEIAKKALS